MLVQWSRYRAADSVVGRSTYSLVVVAFSQNESNDSTCTGRRISQLISIGRQMSGKTKRLSSMNSNVNVNSAEKVRVGCARGHPKQVCPSIRRHLASATDSPPLT